MSEVNSCPELRVVWEERIKNWEQSGLTLVDYCKRHNINKATLYYWRKKLRPLKGSVVSPFIPVRTYAAQGAAPPEHLVVGFSGLSIKIPLTMNRDSMVSLILALGRKEHD